MGLEIQGSQVQTRLRSIDIFQNVKILSTSPSGGINTFKYHVFALMGRFQLELIYLYFPPSFHQIVVVSVL